MKLHLLSIPHTITKKEYSHDAFTNKVRLLAPMMRPLGYEIIHYGVEGADSGANEQVNLISQDEWYNLLGHRFENKKKFHVADADISSPLYTTFNHKLSLELHKRVSVEDIVLHPFGIGHQAILGKHTGTDMELGIGYPESYLPFRVFESSMWMHYHQAKFNREPSFYEWVAYPYFDENEWPIYTKPQADAPYIAFLGRISHTKGCHLISEVAKLMPHMQFVLCGQGDPVPFLTSPNIIYKEPITGDERAKFLGNATATLLPSQYAEPGGHSAIESMLVGTPVLTPPWGCFLETVTHEVNGFHCRVLSDWIRAIEKCKTVDRLLVASSAREKFSLQNIAPVYNSIFKQLQGLATGKHWYTF